jgi:hypothetical protein
VCGLWHSRENGWWRVKGAEREGDLAEELHDVERVWEQICEVLCCVRDWCQ